MSEEKSKDQIKSELESAAIVGIYNILSYLTRHYEQHFDDDYELNLQFVSVFSTMLGDMIGHYPEDLRDKIHEKAINITQKTMVITASELAKDLAMLDDLAQVDEIVEKMLSKFPKGPEL